ncbi:MAG TPA: sigma-70 family RNA polymerase sigma factor [Pyrinomonadaceae bacterium]
MNDKQNENGNDNFTICLNNVLAKLEPIDRLLEHPVFIDRAHLICRSVTSSLPPSLSDSEDIYNEVSLKVTQRLHQFDPTRPRASFFAWLRKLTQNHVIDEMRRNKFVYDAKPAEEHYDLRDTQAIQDEQLWQQQLDEKLNALINGLSLRDKLILRYYFDDTVSKGIEDASSSELEKVSLEGSKDDSFREISKTLKEKHGLRVSHVTVIKVVRTVLQNFHKSSIEFPTVERKTNKPCDKVAKKSSVRRKADKVRLLARGS